MNLLARRESFKLQHDSGEIVFMNALRKPELISVDEYLQGEAVAKSRHEFVAGQIFAMAGASERHNRICFAFAEILGPHLRKHGCRGYLNDMKLRTSNAIYYPDVMAVCDASDQDQLVKSAPCMIIEVLSESTERTDRTEKPFAYQQISLTMIEVDLAAAVELAERFKIYAYDAYLLTCALAQRTPLLTLDHALMAVAKQLNIELPGEDA